MLWARMVVYVTGTVNPRAPVAERISWGREPDLETSDQGSMLLSEGEKATLAEIAQLWYAKIPSSSFRRNVTHCYIGLES
jgi:hypothetical protein